MSQRSREAASTFLAGDLVGLVGAVVCWAVGGPAWACWCVAFVSYLVVIAQLSICKEIRKDRSDDRR